LTASIFSSADPAPASADVGSTPVFSLVIAIDIGRDRLERFGEMLCVRRRVSKSHVPEKLLNKSVSLTGGGVLWAVSEL